MSIEPRKKDSARDKSQNVGGQEAPVDVYGRAVKGGAWLFILRGFMMLLNFVRLPIVVRLLTPYDFGLLRIGTLLTGMAGSFTDLGVRTALVQRREHTQEHLNVVWTIDIIRTLIIFCILYLVAPYAATFFGGSGRFAQGHLLQPDVLVQRLRAANDPASQYLVAELPESTRQMLSGYDPAGRVPEALQERLIEELNRLVEGPILYELASLANVQISESASGDAGERDRLALNRRILEEAFEGVIKPDISDRRTTVLVIRLLALSMVLAAFSNIGTLYFVKELNFRKKVELEIISQLTGFVVTVSLAYMYRNVWALVFGRISEVACTCVLSYVMHPYRPRLCFDLNKARELWRFGKHIMGIATLKYFCLNGDDLVLGRMLGTAALGFYEKAFKIGDMVASEIGNKVAAVAFPAYSKVQDNAVKLRNGYLKSLRLTTLLVFPAAGGLIALAPEITEVVFTAKWLPMVPAMQILCLLGPLKCMQREPIFLAMGRPEVVTRLTIIRFILMAATIYPLTALWGMVGTSLCVLGGAVLMQPIASYELKKLLGVPLREVCGILFYPALGTLIMMLCLVVVKSTIASVGVFWLTALIGLGVVTYVGCLLLLGVLSPRYEPLAPVRDVLRGLK